MTPPPSHPDTTNCLFLESTSKKDSPACRFRQSCPPTHSISPSRESIHSSLEKAASATPSLGGLDHSEGFLQRLSARPYSVRVSDAHDFAHVWETILVPLFVDVLETHYGGEYSVDVHNFPELDSDLVPCIIFVSLPVVAPAALQDRIRAIVAAKMPYRFHHTQLEFRRSTVDRSNWWGTNDLDHDPVCAPRNDGFQAIPTNGASIGSGRSAQDGTLGGFVMAGDKLYGMSCRHVFEEAISKNDLRVVHSGPLRLGLGEDNDANVRELDMGELEWYSDKDSTRQSFTYQGTGHPGVNRVGMDWCLFGPVSEGKNIVFTPCPSMDRVVPVDTYGVIEADTEVFAMGRVSGYSRGFTSRVPGTIRMKDGVRRREWTVRRFCPKNQDTNTHLDYPWQTLQDWVTAGIGSWLMRCEDNAVIGLVWARNYNYGSPVERVRLAYVTPFVDILKDIKEKSGLDVTLPTYSASELRYECDEPRYAQSTLATAHSSEPIDTVPSNNFRLASAGEHTNSISLRDHPSAEGRLQEHVSRSEGAAAEDTAVNSPDTFVPTDSNDEAITTEHWACPVEDLLRGIGAVADGLLGDSDQVPPDLYSDTDSACSEDSILTLDEPQAFNAGDNVQVVGQDVLAEDDNTYDVEEPILSKATPTPSRMTQSPLEPQFRLVSGHHCIDQIGSTHLRHGR